MKKTLAIIVSAALVTALSAGATLAYFTSTDDHAKNSVTMGSVKLTVDETLASQITGNGQTGDGVIVPNQILTKEVTITNKGDVPAYLRVKLAKSWTDKSGNTPSTPASASLIDLKSGDNGSVDGVNSGWVNISGTDYYVWGTFDSKTNAIIPTPVDPNQVIAKPITAFCINSTADNDTYAGLVAHVDVTANAIQTGIDPTDLTSWLGGADVH